MWLVSYVTWTDLIAQVSLSRWSAILFLDELILKIRIIIIIILVTNRPKIILLTAWTTENLVAFT